MPKGEEPRPSVGGLELVRCDYANRGRGWMSGSTGGFPSFSLSLLNVEGGMVALLTSVSETRGGVKRGPF
jgi:hypothetical protein